MIRVRQLLTIIFIKEKGMDNKKMIALSDVEWRLMNTLWTLGEVTLGQIIKNVADAGWSKQSLISFLKRMEAKGAISKDSSRRPSRYTALISQDDAIRQETSALLQRVYGGNPLLMVTSAVNAGRMSEEEIQHLIDLLRKES